MHDAPLFRTERSVQASLLPEDRQGRASTVVLAVALRGRAALEESVRAVRPERDRQAWQNAVAVDAQSCRWSGRATLEARRQGRVRVLGTAAQSGQRAHGVFAVYQPISLHFRL